MDDCDGGEEAAEAGGKGQPSVRRYNGLARNVNDDLSDDLTRRSPSFLSPRCCLKRC
jgi:hypothetical protein